MLRRQIILPVLCVLGLAVLAPARGQNTTSALINRQLDTRQDLDLTGTLASAVDLIEKKTGVHLEVDPAVWDLLPWGRDTTVNATIRNAPLREALSAITAKLGLRFVLTDQAVRLLPEPPLDRLGRRAELPELDVLSTLRQTELPLPQPRPTLNQLLNAIDLEMSVRKIGFIVLNRAPDAVRAQPIDLPKAVSMYDALEAIGHQTSATWYAGGHVINVVPKSAIFRQQLGRHVSARYDGVDVAQVILELFQRESIPFQVQPGAFGRITAARRPVRIMLQDASLRDALQAIGGETGLNFEPTNTGICVWDDRPNPEPATPPSTTPSSTAPASLPRKPPATSAAPIAHPPAGTTRPSTR